MSRKGNCFAPEQTTKAAEAAMYMLKRSLQGSQKMRNKSWEAFKLDLLGLDLIGP